MEMANQSPLFDQRAIHYVFSYIMHHPSKLYSDDKILLTVDDFPGKLDSIIFGALYNLAFTGINRITPVNLENYLTGFQAQYDTYIALDGPRIVSLFIDLAAEDDEKYFDLYYSRVKKFTTLRELKAKGFSVDEFYNPSYLNKEDEEERFNRLTVADILSKIREKVQLVENKHFARQDSVGQYASKGIRNLLSELRAMPEVGIPIQGEILNYTTRGCRKGKMYMYSAPSGGGKTRTMVGNACSIAFPYIENGKLVRREQLRPVLFVATEMSADEIQTLILAWISGVDEEKILLGSYSEDEEKLLNIAIKIMEQYEKNFIIEAIPNPSIKTLKGLITNYILNDDIEYIFYDYIFTSVGLMNEFHAVGLREDVVLMMLSNTLKEIAAEYNVFVMTGTQLNGTWEGKMTRNANMLRGSKAIADKIDVGVIGVRCCQEEIEQIQEYAQSMGVGIPNLVLDVYKNRRGKMCDVKIFRSFHYGTCRTKDLFATTQNYRPLDGVIKFQYETVQEELSAYGNK